MTPENTASSLKLFKHFRLNVGLSRSIKSSKASLVENSGLLYTAGGKMAKKDIFVRTLFPTWNFVFQFWLGMVINSSARRNTSEKVSLPTSQQHSHPFTFELFLPGCRGSWEEAGSRGSAGWSASWLEAAPAGAGPEDGEAALAFKVFWRLDT